MVIIVVLPSSACVAALSAQAHLDHLRSPTRGETNGKTQCSGEGREAERETDGAEGMSTRTIISRRGKLLYHEYRRPSRKAYPLNDRTLSEYAFLQHKSWPFSSWKANSKRMNFPALSAL